MLTFIFRLPYWFLFGGIQAFKKADYVQINGYSNRYFGWGSEDDDLSRRVVSSGFKLTRPSATIGRYKMNMLKHNRSDERNPENDKVYNSNAKEQHKDGLNSISSLNFTTTIHEEQFCTFVSIDIFR